MKYGVSFTLVKNNSAGRLPIQDWTNEKILANLQISSFFLLSFGLKYILISLVESENLVC